jgi:hypothetical protein
MSYLSAQLRAQAFILADDTITVADAPPQGTIATAAAATGIGPADEAQPPADDPGAG